MEDLLKKKMEIAKRAGQLNKAIERLSSMAEVISKNKSVNFGGNKSGPETIYLRISTQGMDKEEINSYEIDPGGAELHDALLTFLNSQIYKRTAELNDLIKVLA